MAHVNWNNPQTGERAQFVADVIKESLFDYAFDSNKIPSLNLHFFCKDYLSTYNLVKEGTMKVGNMIPLNEEFENILATSPWLPEGIGLSMLSFRGKNGEYQDAFKDKNLDDAKRSEYYSDCVAYINDRLDGKNSYCSLLLLEIATLLKGQAYGYEEQEMLYFCTREFLCELVNIGISKTHIYNETLDKLFSAITPADDIQYIVDFLQSLRPSVKKYTVVLGISKIAYEELNGISKSLRVATADETKRIGAEYVAETIMEEYDPVSAVSNAKKTIAIFLGMYNSFVHSEEMTVLDAALVKQENQTHFRKVNSSPNLMRKHQSKRKGDRMDGLRVTLSSNLSGSLMGAFELHNVAINSRNPETQLLMMWTIFEILIETSQDTMSRVNYITNAVSSILCNQYHARIIHTLYKQISLTTSVITKVASEQRGNSREEKLAFILKDNTTLQEKIKAELSTYPLEVFKINKYSQILSNPETMKENMRRHSRRVRWQVMRIYRNRCMIVHDGSHLPYINNIIENLHFYVDSMLDFMILQAKGGMSNPKAIFSAARVQEKNTLDLLSRKHTALNDKEFVSTVFCSERE